MHNTFNAEMTSMKIIPTRKMLLLGVEPGRKKMPSDALLVLLLTTPKHSGALVTFWE